MAITYINDAYTNSGSQNTLTVSEGAGWAENDLILFWGVLANTGSGSWTSTPSDMTEIDAISEAGTPPDPRQIWAGYKIRASGAGQALTLTHSATASNMSIQAMCFRGVDTSTPLDVTYVRANHYEVEASGSWPPADNPPITTVTNNAFVIVLTTNSDDGSFTQVVPSGYTLIRFGTQFDVMMQSAYKEVTSAGTETPGTWGTTNLVSTADIHCLTFAIRPATTSTNETVYPFTGPWR